MTNRTFQEILHALIDRHNNLEKFRTLQIPLDVIGHWDLSVEAPPRQDMVFVKKYGAVLFSHLYENAQKTNNKVGSINYLIWIKNKLNALANLLQKC